MEKQKKTLVMGAAGFIAYHTFQRLLDEGWCVVDLRSEGSAGYGII